MPVSFRILVDLGYVGGTVCLWDLNRLNPTGRTFL